MSQDGRLFQVEYAEKAVENSSTILGVQCKDGIILGTEKVIVNKMMMPGSDKRLYSIALNCGGIINGLTPDGRSIIQKAREECCQYKDQFHV